MKSKVIVTGLLGAMALGGCSVKEDREPCPLFLSLDMEAMRSHSGAAWAVIRHEDGIVREEVFFTDYNSIFKWRVTKGEVAVSAYCGIEERLLKGHRMIVPKGERAPLFLGSAYRSTCFDEELQVIADDRRQSARMNLQAVFSDGKPYPYDILLEGNVCGTDLLTLSPVEGEFSHMVELDEDDSASFQILRQDESSVLTLHLIEDAKIIESIPLNEWILRAGYDWKSEDLEDIGIRLEHGRIEIAFVISDWLYGGEESKYEFTF